MHGSGRPAKRLGAHAEPNAVAIDVVPRRRRAVLRGTDLGIRERGAVLRGDERVYLCGSRSRELKRGSRRFLNGDSMGSDLTW